MVRYSSTLQEFIMNPNESLSISLNYCLKQKKEFAKVRVNYEENLDDSGVTRYEVQLIYKNKEIKMTLRYKEIYNFLIRL